MNNRLSVYSDSRDNNFNLIRFVAASLVLFSHSYALIQLPEPMVQLIGMSWATIAVNVFFITSGFLVAGSLFARNNLLAFIWARVLRIYPALIVAMIFCVFFIGWYFTTESSVSYFSDPETIKFFIRNTTLFNGVSYELPGVFESNLYPGAVNGSLWTLPFEIDMYAYLALICCALTYVKKYIDKEFFKAAFFLITFTAVAIAAYSHSSDPVNYDLHFFALFFSGSCFFLLREHICMSFRLFALLAILLFLSAFNQDIFYFSFILFSPYLVIYLAYVPGGLIRNFNKLGDYSYGIYIYAFPVQQSISALFPGVSVSTMITLSFTITLLLACLSWHLVEKNILRFKGSYVIFEGFIRKLHNKISFRFLRLRVSGKERKK